MTTFLQGERRELVGMAARDGLGSGDETAVLIVHGYLP